MFRTVPLSIISSFSLYTHQCYMSYRFGDSLRAGLGWKFITMHGHVNVKCAFGVNVTIDLKNTRFVVGSSLEKCQVLHNVHQKVDTV